MKLTPREKAAVTIGRAAARMADLATELLKIEQGTPPRRPVGRAMTARDSGDKLRMMPARARVA